MKITSTALALILAAGTASAEGLDYLSFGLSYGSTTSDFSSDLEMLNLNGAFEYQRSQVIFMGEARSLQFTVGSDDFTVSEAGVRIGYEFAPGAIAYAGIGQLKFDNDVERTTHEAGAQYGTDMYQLGVNFKSFDEAFETVTVAGAYQVSPQIEVGALFSTVLDEDFGDAWMVYGRYEDGPLDLTGSFQSLGAAELDVLDVRATYEFGGQFRALGGLTYLKNNDGGDDVTGVVLGAGYNVAENIWIDTSYSSVSSDMNEQNTMGLMLTYEFGDQSLVTDRADDVRGAPFESMGGQFSLLTLFAGTGI